MTRSSNIHRSSRTQPVGPSVSRRTKTVWGALVGSMTIVGAMLSMMAGGPEGVRAGVTLTPMLSMSGASSIEAVFQTREEIAADRWQAIVIHDTGSPVGSAAKIDEAHRAHGFDGLGFHFLVGNGAGMGDGEIHVGYRWLDQLPGAHVAGPEGELYNRVAVGIAAVGDGSHGRFSDEQVYRLAQLTAALATQLGIGEDQILLHSELADVESPGTLFPRVAFRDQVRALLR